MEDTLDQVEAQLLELRSRWTERPPGPDPELQTKLEIALVDLGQAIAFGLQLIYDSRAANNEVAGSTLLLAAAVHQAGGELLVRDDVLEVVSAIEDATITHFRDIERQGVSVRLVVTEGEEEGDEEEA